MHSQGRSPRVAVFGGTGAIGSVICESLVSCGFEVTALARGATPYASASGKTTIRCGVDVRHLTKRMLGEYAPPRCRFEAVIYAVGSCPPNGFGRAVGTPLHRYSVEDFEKEVETYAVGLLSVFHWCLSPNHPILADGGRIVVIGSAITRFNDKNPLPDWLHAWHHVAVMAAQERLVQGMRFDPLVRARGVQVYGIRPAAVDTPFHAGSDHRPSALVSPQEVADEVAKALAVDNQCGYDMVLLPQK